jgi:hypothetical protein
MRRFRMTLAVLATLAAGSSAAWAQYGMYGSPDMLPVPQQNYPAQPAASTAYEPHQPGAQYRYPTPASSFSECQRTAWASLAEPQSQQIPTPAGEPVPMAPPPSDRPTPQYPCTIAPAPMTQGCGPRADACGEAIACGQECCYPWYASMSAILLSRSDARRVWTSYEHGDETNQLTNTQFGLEWKAGGEGTLGRRFCCDCVPLALETTFWSGEAFFGSNCTTNPGGYVSTPLALNRLDFGSLGASLWFDDAQEHRLWRRDEYYNLEVNLVREQLAWACDSRWDIGWSFGVRYFRFQDFLQFGTLNHNGANWGDLPNTAYLSDRATNNLIGAQVGFDASWRMFNNVRLFVSPKFGIYDNYLESDFQAHTGNGIQARSPYGSFPVQGSANDIAFLTQIDAGVDWQFSRNWSARVGYRVVAISGVGLADDQFPQYITDIPEIEHVSRYSSLVLHGAFAGITYNF